MDEAEWGDGRGIRRIGVTQLVPLTREAAEWMTMTNLSAYAETSGIPRPPGLHKSQNYKVDFEYKEERVVHRYDPSEHEHEHEEWIKVNHVPLARRVAYFKAAPKIMRPISRQLPSESHRLLESVTSKLLSKEYGKATHAKHCRSSSSASGTRRPTGSDAASSILIRISRAAYRHLRKPGPGREAFEAEIKYEHEDKNEDSVERDNGGVPVSQTRLQRVTRHVRRRTTIYTLSLASSFTFLYRVLCWSFSIWTCTTSFSYPYTQLVMRIQYQALQPRDKETDKAALRPSL
ncbi:hypothetical protein EDB84DRAFT_1673714 [Lactarius hengduanensis]|nr:hypothetical protein EDB84DRAFT_1673714 [Lactarius hengduanensis]